MTRAIRTAALVAALAALVPPARAAAQPGGRIDLAKMRPAGLLVDAYSYMTPPHNAYYFHHIDELGFRIDPVRRAGPEHPLATSPDPLALRYASTDGLRDLEDYFVRNHLTGFLVLRGDTILLERYFHGADRSSRFVSQSVGKSILSILIGIAIDRGLIGDVADPVVRYLPELGSSGYRDATIEQVLQMSTGIAYSEDYRDSTSGAAQIGAALVTGRPTFSEFVRSMRAAGVAPGTAFEYQSVNSQLLGMLLERVTGESLASWTERVLWSVLGADADGFFYQARAQPDTCAFACFNATLRDYGRIGLLMLGRGAIAGRRVVSESWVRRSTTAGAPYLRPSAGEAGSPPRLGYGYHWWIPPGNDGAFLAIGIFGQSIYVNPARRLVVVQTAAWPVPVGDAMLSAERAAVLRALESAVAGR